MINFAEEIKTLKDKSRKNIVSGQEYATDEYIDGKQVYIKNIVTSEPIGGDGNFQSIAHNISDVDLIWLDLSNTFFQSNSGISYSLPMVMYGENTDKNAVQTYVDKTNINFITDGGWGLGWIKHIRLKYTKI